MTTAFVVAITGASGAVYAVRLIDVLLSQGCDVQLSISPAGQSVLKQELGLDVDLDAFQLASLLPSDEGSQAAGSARLRQLLGAWPPARQQGSSRQGTLRYYHFTDYFAPMASGSAASSGMVVCPCSGGTLSAIAHGGSDNLIQRAADVHLKERRRLILVPRETPLSLLQLDNMRRCVEAGAIVLPAMPGWYHGVGHLSDLVDFVVCRICDQLGLSPRLMRRWGE